jgi:hypothetical protein
MAHNFADPEPQGASSSGAEAVANNLLFKICLTFEGKQEAFLYNTI